MHAKLFQFCPALWDPMDCSPPGSSAHGILQTTGVGCHALLQRNVNAIFQRLSGSETRWKWNYPPEDSPTVSSVSCGLSGCSEKSPWNQWWVRNCLPVVATAENWLWNDYSVLVLPACLKLSQTYSGDPSESFFPGLGSLQGSESRNLPTWN